LIDLFYDKDSYVYARQDARQTVIVAINRQSDEKRITVRVDSIGLKDGVRLKSLTGVESVSVVANGEATLNLLPMTAVAFKVF